MSIFSTGGNIGIAVGPLLATALIVRFGLPGSLGMLIPGLLVAALLTAVLPMLSAPSALRAQSALDPRPTMAGAMGLLVLVIALRSWTQVGFTTYVPFYYIEVLHGDPTMVGTLLGVFLGAGVLGTLAAGPIADRVGMRRFMVSTLLLIVPIAVSFLFVSRPYAVLVLGILGFVLVSTFTVSVCWARPICAQSGDGVGHDRGLRIGRAGSGRPRSADRRPLGTGERALDLGGDAARRLRGRAVPPGTPREVAPPAVAGMALTDRFEDSEQALLIDQREKRHLIILRKGDTFHSDRGFILHDTIIGQPDGCWVKSSKGMRYLALRPTLSEYVLDMPRGAQVIYPKDLAIVMFWADIFPGARVLEAGMGSGALTLALLRSVGPEGKVVSYEQREDFCRRALANIHLRMGEVKNLVVRLRPVEEGLAEEEPVDRAVFDLPEPWRLVDPVASVLRSGGIFLSYVPTIIQSHQLSETLRRHPGYALVETFETLLRPWNIDGTSVRPFHRMVAHTGFLTVARRVVPAEVPAPPAIGEPEAGGEPGAG